MAEKKPLKATYTGSDPTGVGEFASTDTLPLTNVPAHAITDATRHTSTATSGKILKANGSGLPVDATNTDSEVSAAVTASHAAVTLGADAGALLGLSTQELTLDSQAANIVFAGPAAGAAADPTFRALVAADLVVTMTREVRIATTESTHGASAPNDANRAVGASGGVLLPVDQFSKTVQNDVHFILHAPSDIDGTVNGEFHLMWLPGAAWTAGNYMWKLEYLVKTDGDSYATGTPTTIQADVTPASATALIETEFASTIDLNLGQTLWCHFYRDVANDNGDDTGDIYMYEFSYTSKVAGGEA